MSWIFGANLVVAFTKWLIIIIIARILTPTDVGAYALAFAIGAPITLFANMKLRSLFITEDSKSFSDYLYSRCILNFAAFILLMLIATIIYPQHFYIIFLVGLMKILDLQSDMYYALPHKEGNMNIIGKLMIVKHVFTLFIFLVCVLITNNLIHSLFSQLIAQLLFLYSVEKKYISTKYTLNNESFDTSKILSVIVVGIPLGLVQMMTSFNASFPRFLLEFYESTEVLGYFSVIIYVLLIGNMMMNAISQTFLPYLYNKIKKFEYYHFHKLIFVKLSLFSMFLGIILFLLSHFFGEGFLFIVYGENYAQYSDVLTLMSIALAINIVSWNFDTALLAMRYISIQPKIIFIVLIISLIIGYILINKYGIYGATYTIIIANLLHLILRVFFVKIRLNMLISGSTVTR
ncbi:lipopolysaccharide biosynthesis protein [Alkalicoccus luteus]|uniref:lipopolysaccharide biosynthesis protein n=1 Tax=Alkalicoccus luteus TaxID=1237094 RepID=UPI0031B569EA